jgi:hypothetical protein
LLINTYRTPVSGVFRRKDFWFRGLWRKPGQRFAVCGGNPAWQQWRRPRENGQRPASAHHPVARVGGQRVHLGDLLQEVERPELAAVPDHAFPQHYDGRDQNELNIGAEEGLFPWSLPPWP